MSTPETSIDSIAVTYALMGPVMAIYRPVAALVSAIVTGLLTTLVKDAPVAARTENQGESEATGCCAPTSGTDKPACCASTEAVSANKLEARWWLALKYASAELLDDIAFWMAVGIVVAGAMLTFIPDGWLAQWGSGLPAMLIMLLVGIPMYICAVASTPIAAGLLLAGVSPGVVLVFLLVGPATNVASFALVRRELGNKVTAIYLIGIASVSLIMALLLEELLRLTGWQVNAIMGMGRGFLPEWLSMGSALLLLLLAIKPLRQRLLPALG